MLGYVARRDSLTNTIQPGETLRPNVSYVAQNGRYSFLFQGDGNLVLYGPTGAPLWASGTSGRQVTQAILQTDGNLVLYGPQGAIWESRTAGNPGSSLVVQDDGNAVIYAPGQRAVWETATWSVKTAMVFLNRTVTPDFGTKVFPGHVGWAFELDNGNMLYGSKETVPGEGGEWNVPCVYEVKPGRKNGVFIGEAKFPTILERLTRGRYADGPRFDYHQYKLIQVRNPHVNHATTVAWETKKSGYCLLGNNCMDDTYKVLSAYACHGPALPNPSLNLLPSGWFDAIPGGACLLKNW